MSKSTNAAKQVEDTRHGKQLMQHLDVHQTSARHRRGVPGDTIDSGLSSLVAKVRQRDS